MKQSDLVTAVSAYVVACLAAQEPPVQLQGDGNAINYGLDYLPRANAFPRVVATPSPMPEPYGPRDTMTQDMSDPSQGTFTPASFGRVAMIDFHCWGADETGCEALVSMICEALQQVASGVSRPVRGYWPQIKSGETIADQFGRKYILTVSCDMPVTLAQYPAITGVSAAQTTEMDFPDGTSQQDPE